MNETGLAHKITDSPKGIGGDDTAFQTEQRERLLGT